MKCKLFIFCCHFLLISFIFVLKLTYNFYFCRAINKHDKKYDEDHSYCKDSPYEVFSRRLINILISKSNLKASSIVQFTSALIEYI